MKIPLQFLAPLLLALTGIASAGMPVKVGFDRYRSLVTDSPFTSEPEIGPTNETNPFADYTLIGVSPIGEEGYRVTLINRQQPDKRITVDSGKVTASLSVVGVELQPGNPLGTIVRLMKHSKTGIVRFDEKHLTPAAPAAQRQPRTRVIPPTPLTRTFP